MAFTPDEVASVVKATLTDPQGFLNTEHVPKDAGEYAEGLAAILRRIPDGWGKWIDCGRGWYPLLIETDQKLAALDPHYEVWQVKEKFGGLRYYFCFVTDGTDEEAGQAIVDEAERKSFTICEVCGTTQDVTTGGSGWVTSRCSACHQKSTRLGEF